MFSSTVSLELILDNCLVALHPVLATWNELQKEESGREGGGMKDKQQARRFIIITDITV